ncbi:uncharacterized protein LOC123217147 isoform X2 [Mangifera indica]|uniref:uncharacterized protein LOC123217147 isoform X2 n=1 Tax=Mangifera indica TaxID=29780 RepID=UPI001CFBEDDA|nr:uncharacterized protein LOC123217147 isoform X2 [Mangifera indica]
MVENLILYHCSYLILSLLLIFSSSTSRCYTFSVSSFRYPETRLKPFDSRYIRFDLPPWFSSLSIQLESNVDLDIKRIAKVPLSALPLICLRDGSLPLPDVSETTLNGLVLGALSNGSSKGLQNLENVEQCFPMQKNISVKLTNEQIPSGVWYLGLFNGVGDTRTQSKMIVRGLSHSFIVNISVEGCTTSTIWGQFCNQTVNSLFCVQSNSYNLTGNISDSEVNNRTTVNVVSCRNSFNTLCHGIGETNVYSLDVVGITEQLTIMAMNVRFNMTPSNNTVNVTGTSMMCFARHGALPSATLYDFSADIHQDPLTIPSPKVGRWYITVIPVNLSKEIGDIHDIYAQVCYSLEWQVLECPMGKAGPNCTWERYNLQTGIRRSYLFESSYRPVSGKVPTDSADFPLEPLLSNSSYGESDDIWTYFLMDVPVGAAGGNVHIQLESDTEITYEIYAKFGGLPSLQSWDYYYANRTKSSTGSTFFKLYNSSEVKVDFYILYAREGTWGFGIRNVNKSISETIMSISLERCPRRCSDHGHCRYAFDASGLTSYSYCSCDRDHGGFDCSVEIVSRQRHIWQSISLIASNAAALLPAYLALRRKAFAEWVLFTSSGISSGLYHACDVGTWCALSYNVLQFMDFWLSFMAVVSTFVYLTTFDEAFKRTIHTAVAILTALVAITKATRSSNIILVLSIGTLVLLLGWVVELSTKFRSFSFSIEFFRSLLGRQQTVTQRLRDLIKTLLRQFQWAFVLAGFAALAMAAISWNLESSENYWIWHSVWHVTIYTSSFFFLCSKVDNVNSENQTPVEGSYELTRQDSIPRDDGTE